MCYVLAAGALCAVFAPVPTSADKPPPPAVAQARPAVQPASRPASAHRTPAAYAPRGDTEAKSSPDEGGDPGSAPSDDTERK